jgi:phospholipid-binding lipoprotein MlaA
MAKTSGVRQRLTLAAACGAAMLLAGCVSNPAYQNPRDPLEALNRGIFQFNEEVDNLILKPIAKGYQAITPDPVDRGVTNFFDNIADVRNAVNNALQFKMTRAVTSVGRILVNSTVGVLGFADVASNMNLPKYNEDFGQTLGTWGVGPGPFIVLPFLGPSTGRDTVGLVADWYTDPLTYVNDGGVAWGAKGLRIIDRRADLLAASRVLEEAALDPDSFVRDAFLQRRHSDIYDGNPPPDPEELDDADEADAAAATPAN